MPAGAIRILAAWIAHLRGAGAPVTDAGAAPFTAAATPRDVLHLLDPALVDWAYRLTAETPLDDTPGLQAARARYTGFPVAQTPPRVMLGVDHFQPHVCLAGQRGDRVADLTRPEHDRVRETLASQLGSGLHGPRIRPLGKHDAPRPLPCALALVGWLYMYISAGLQYMLLGLDTLGVGAIVFFLWSRGTRTWPFKKAPRPLGGRGRGEGRL